jgi:hypothetical protein
MTLDLNKEIDDVVRPIDSPSRFTLSTVVISVLSAALLVIIGAWFTGFVSFTRASPAPQETTSGAHADLKIKGNKNSRIYHLPSCPNYNDISPQNIVWFKTQEEARAAGFRMARNC